MFYVRVATRSSGAAAQGSPRQALGYLADNHDRERDAGCSEAELNYIARLDPGWKTDLEGGRVPLVGYGTLKGVTEDQLVSRFEDACQPHHDTRGSTGYKSLTFTLPKEVSLFAEGHREEAKAAMHAAVQTALDRAFPGMRQGQGQWSSPPAAAQARLEGRHRTGRVDLPGNRARLRTDNEGPWLPARMANRLGPPPPPEPGGGHGCTNGTTPKRWRCIGWCRKTWRRSMRPSKKGGRPDCRSSCERSLRDSSTAASCKEASRTLRAKIAAYLVWSPLPAVAVDFVPRALAGA